MRSLALLCCLLAAACVPAAAQVYLGAEVGPDSFMKDEEPGADTFGEDAFAWALSSEVSSSTLYAVFGSTSPEKEIMKYLRQGLYRQELCAVLLLSERTSIPFSKLAPGLRGGGLRALAAANKADAMELFAAGGGLKEAADLRLPLFLSVYSSTAAPAVELSTAPAAPPGGAR